MQSAHRSHAGAKLAVLSAALVAAFAQLRAQSIGFSPPQVVGGASHAAQADIDGDGDHDLVVIQGSPPELGAFLNNGSRQFAYQALMSQPLAAGSTGLAVGDIDGDGDVDAVVTGGGNAYSAYHNDGSGVFALAGSGAGLLTSPTGVSPSYLTRPVLDDVDMDGDLDLVVAASDGYYTEIFVIEGLGPIGFGSAVLAGTGTGGQNGGFIVPKDFVLGDYDGDGDKDLFVAADWFCAYSGCTGAGPIYLFRNYGGVDFFGAHALPSGVQVPSSFGGPSALHWVDVDGDGSPELVWSNWGTGDIEIAAHDGQGGLVQRTSIAADALGATQIALVDMDADGDLDCVAWSNGDPWNTQWNSTFPGCIGIGQPPQVLPEVFYYLQSASGNFGPRQNLMGFSAAWYEPVCGFTRRLFVSDFNGDGSVDFARNGPGLNVFYNHYQPGITATATSYGIGCGVPALALSASSAPVIGSQVDGGVSNVATPFCLLNAGFSNAATAGGALLPFDLSIIGMAGCMLHHSSEVIGLPTTLGAGGTPLDFSITIPNDPFLVGQHLYIQAFNLAPGVSAPPVISSNGIDLLIGNQ